MKKAVGIAVIILISISSLFIGLFFDYETYGFLAVLALLSIIYFFIKIVKHEPVHINKLYVSVGALLLAAVCFSYAAAMNQRETLEALLLYLELLIVFIVLYDSFYDEKKQFMQALMLPVVLTGVIAGFVGMIALTGKFDVWQVTIKNSRVGTTFQYANTASVYFVICFILALTLANTYKSRVLRSLMTGFGSILIFAFFMTGSRGGFLVGTLALLLLFAAQPGAMKLGAAIGILCSAAPVFTVFKGFNAGVAAGDNFETGKWIVISFILSAVIYFILSLITDKAIKDMQIKRTKWAGIAFIAFVAVSAGAVFIFKDAVIQLLPPIMAKRIDMLFSEGLRSKNVLFRLEYNKDALKLLASHWLFGTGGNGWRALYQSVQDFFYTAAYVHNHYYQIFVDHGIFGFIAYTAMMIIAAASAVYSYIRTGDRMLKSCAAGLLCAFVALAVHSAIDFDLSFISLVLMLWAMFAAAAVDPPARDIVNRVANVENKGDRIGDLKDEEIGYLQDNGIGDLRGNEIGDIKGEGIRGRLTGIIGFAHSDRWKIGIPGNIGKLILVAVCSLLLSMFALYFAAAYNSQIALDFMLKRNYKDSMAYYEEANRLDPTNTAYIFELAKIYHYYGRNSADSDTAGIWLEKARDAGEYCVRGYKNYPPYMNTLVRIYLDSDMPVEAMELARKLTACQKYNAEVYELLAQSYIDAALFYRDNGDAAKAKELLELCLEIDNDPYLRRSVVDRPDEVDSAEVLESYEHSDELAGYLEKAKGLLTNLE